MNLYFDKSALVKFFHKETGTEEVTDLILSDKNNIWISQLAQLEFSSALYRRYRNREISKIELNKSIQAFEEQITAYNIEPLSQGIVNEAKSLLIMFGEKHGLRTLDSIQLATFLLISEKKWAFITSDENLCKVVKKAGYSFINPAK